MTITAMHQTTRKQLCVGISTEMKENAWNIFSCNISVILQIQFVAPTVFLADLQLQQCFCGRDCRRLPGNVCPLSSTQPMPDHSLACTDKHHASRCTCLAPMSLLTRRKCSVVGKCVPLHNVHPTACTEWKYGLENIVAHWPCCPLLQLIT